MPLKKKKDLNQSNASESTSCTLINKLGNSLLAIGRTISINGPCEGEDKSHVAFIVNTWRTDSESA